MARGLFEGWHLPLLIIVLVLLFGAKRLPDAARGLGRSLRIFKSEVEGLKTDTPSPVAVDQTEAGPGAGPLQSRQQLPLEQSRPQTNGAD